MGDLCTWKGARPNLLESAKSCLRLGLPTSSTMLTFELYLWIEWLPSDRCTYELVFHVLFPWPNCCLAFKASASLTSRPGLLNSKCSASILCWFWKSCNILFYRSCSFPLRSWILTCYFSANTLAAWISVYLYSSSIVSCFLVSILWRVLLSL